jgi:hypothetical protein
MSKRAKLITGIIISLCFVGMVQLVLAGFTDFVYLPFVAVQGTFTPTSSPTTTGTVTLTPTPTRTPTPTPTATPYGGIEILEIVNSPNSNPLDEYVLIYNGGTKTTDLTDWYIRDDGQHRYDFPKGFVLLGKQKVWVWTKAGTNSTYELFWGSSEEVWNDTHDCAYLRDNTEGEKLLVDVLCYSNTALGPVFYKPTLLPH